MSGSAAENESREPRESCAEVGVPLSLFMACWIALAIGGSMAVYAAVQYAWMPESSMVQLFLRHLGHIIALGAVIHLCCFLILRWVLFRPLNRIYLHLYRLGAGELGSLAITSPIREIRTIVDGINLMNWRLSKWMDPEAIEQARCEREAIREIGRQLRLENQDLSEALIRHADALESLAPRRTEERTEAGGSSPALDLGAAQEKIY